jgi:hypothetical protein
MVYRAVVVFIGLLGFSALSLAQDIPMMPPPGQHGSTSLAGPTRYSNSLSGSVLGPNNQPVHDVRVELRDSHGLVVTSTVTGGGGEFEFRQVPLGMYQIIAFSGLETAEARIEVSSLNGPISLRLSGPKAPPHDNASRNSISVAQYQVPDKAREELKKAREASLKGKIEETQAHLAKALEIYPQYADALTLRAILKLGDRDSEGAVADVQKAIEYDANYAMAYLVLGSAFNIQARFDDAIIALQRGQTLSPDAWQGYFELGKAYAGKNEYESALQQLDRAQTLGPPNYPLIRLVRAHVFMQLNRFADAITDLQIYLAKNPQGADLELAQKMLESAKASLEAQK